MAFAAKCASWVDLAVLDREVGRFFDALSYPHRERVGMWTGCTGRSHRRIHLATAHADQATKMGADPSLACALTRDDSYGERLSLEFSVAAFLSSHSRDLRCGSAPCPAGLA